MIKISPAKLALAAVLAIIPVSAQAGTKASAAGVGATKVAAKGIPKGLSNALTRANANGQKGILRAIRNHSNGC